MSRPALYTAGLIFHAGMRSGRTQAMRLSIRAEACTEEEATKAIADMEDHGVALLDAAGRHVPSPHRRPPGRDPR